MKYCVVKDTTKVIDGSGNSAETMLQNAQNAGFTENQIEILTEEEYQARKVLEPIPRSTGKIEQNYLRANRKNLTTHKVNNTT